MVDKCVRPIVSSDMIHIIFAKDFCKRQRKFKYTTERQSFRYGSVKRFKSRQVLEVATLIVMLFFFYSKCVGGVTKPEDETVQCSIFDRNILDFKVR